jgi:hypothetical protein
VRHRDGPYRFHFAAPHLRFDVDLCGFHRRQVVEDSWGEVAFEAVHGERFKKKRCHTLMPSGSTPAATAFGQMLFQNNPLAVAQLFVDPRLKQVSYLST